MDCVVRRGHKELETTDDFESHMAQDIPSCVHHTPFAHPSAGEHFGRCRVFLL